MIPDSRISYGIYSTHAHQVFMSRTYNKPLQNKIKKIKVVHKKQRCVQDFFLTGGESLPKFTIKFVPHSQ